MLVECEHMVKVPVAAVRQIRQIGMRHAYHCRDLHCSPARSAML